MEQAHIKAATPKITVFTPAYNRAHLLQRLYDSLLEQTYKDFEWIIVNDGSSDNTEEAIQSFAGEGKLFINHIFQQNSGKQVAINRGVMQAKGELFFIVDSDDWLPADALESITYHWNNVKQLPNYKEFAGVSGNRLHSNGEVNGGTVDYDVLDADIFFYRQHKKYQGDKAEAYATEILRNYPFPEFENEKYCPESLIWNRIGDKFKIRYFNKGIYFGDYLEGGITDRSIIIRAIYPRYTALVYSELAGYAKVPFLRRLKASVNYWRFAPYNSYQSFAEKSASIKWLWSTFCMPAGYLWYLYERKKISSKI